MTDLLIFGSMLAVPVALFLYGAWDLGYLSWHGALETRRGAAKTLFALWLAGGALLLVTIGLGSLTVWTYAVALAVAIAVVLISPKD